MKLLTFVALVAASQVKAERWLQDADDESSKQEPGDACTAWKISKYEDFEKIGDNILADASSSTEESAKLDWMAANLYDPAADDCGKGTVCVYRV